MNWAHIHLLLNHVPGLGTIFGLALLGYGVLQGSDALQARPHTQPSSVVRSLSHGEQHSRSVDHRADR